ncbi:Zn(2)-C6 fungal-type domain-containing protein [Favolaschia claudopus]|uniref:Zn(2)-C6 fungal-type domain-containing protein n=1 Tax=Favolaschia claudopus TaxID=2862362 RepID=A0AAW0CXP3_9AGAR
MTTTTSTLEFVYEDILLPKRQRHRACDVCRRMKRRCDGKHKCNSCQKYAASCTYILPAEPRPRPPRIKDSPPSAEPSTLSAAYVSQLHRRLKTAEAALLKVQNANPPANQSLLIRAIKCLEEDKTPSRSSSKSAIPHPDDIDAEFIQLSESMRSISLDNGLPDPGFQGRSSAAMFVKSAVMSKPTARERFCPGPKLKGNDTVNTGTSPAYSSWAFKSWLPPSTAPPTKHYSFPSRPHLHTLISLYFTHINPSLPILQRTIFLAFVELDVQERYYAFTCTLLLVCALGTLYLPDLSVGERVSEARGWYERVEFVGETLRYHPTVLDLQAYCLAAHFLHLTSDARAAWSLVGFGIRIGEDIGAHRLRINSYSGGASQSSAEEELEKRMMWILLMMDTHFGASLGRVRVVNDRDLDIPLPLECDDEYWEPWGPGRQPADRPSAICFFTSMLTLSRLVQFATSALYCHSYSREFLDVKDTEVAQADLDVALDRWLAGVPKHLKWDLDHVETISDHAASLACYYYYARILVRCSPLSGIPIKPLDLFERKKCTQAAYACIRVAEVQHRKRPEGYPLMFSQIPLFTAAMVLVITLTTDAGHDELASDDAGEGSVVSKSKSKSDVTLLHVAIEILEAQQKWWPSSEFNATVLKRLVIVNELEQERSES